jgi:hypothetical protein
MAMHFIVVSGIWYLVSGIWYLVSGIWYQVQSTKYKDTQVEQTSGLILFVVGVVRWDRREPFYKIRIQISDLIKPAACGTPLRHPPGIFTFSNFHIGTLAPVRTESAGRTFVTLITFITFITLR